MTTPLLPAKSWNERALPLASRSKDGKITAVRQRDFQHHTYADYLVWSADSGNELIDGVAYVREPPSPSVLHQEFVLELAHQITSGLPGKAGRVYVAPLDVRLPKAGAADDQIDTVVQPDVFIARDLQKLDDRGMCGTPDWVAEVLSPSTARYDRTTKLAAYERAGVPEIWLIDPAARAVAIYLLVAGQYARPAVLALEGRTAITTLPGIRIDWGNFPGHVT